MQPANAGGTAGTLFAGVPGFGQQSHAGRADVLPVGVGDCDLACALKREQRWEFILAGACIALAALCKYSAIALIPLLALTGMTRQRWPTQLCALLIPLAALAIFEIFTAHRYGQGLIHSAVSYSSQIQEDRAAYPDATGRRSVLHRWMFPWGGDVPADGLWETFSHPRNLSCCRAIRRVVFLAPNASAEASE